MATLMKVAIVTGAGSGIGKATALGLLREGFSVALAGRRAAALDQTASESRDLRSQTLAIPTDITDPSSVRSLFERTREKFGRVDLLFNNAGINVPAAPIEELSFEDWNSVLQTNVTGAFLCAQQAFLQMKNQSPQGGRIINNGSISAHVPRPNAIAYNAAKHAITGLTKSLMLDGRAFNIACGQIDIGNTATEMASKMNRGVLQANGSIATEPTFDVQHVVRAVLYMASLPLEANVPFLTVMATQMPYAGRG
jgi:NAD(P)-dependent dehydrogenase (short-subunit alcohol dehydrogenase family)